MTVKMLLVGIAFFTSASLSASLLAADSGRDLAIVYSTNINGEVVPCPT